MKTWLISILLVAAPVFGGQPRVRPITGLLTLYTQFQQAPPDGVLDSIKSEVQNIMAPAGTGIEWRSLAGVSGDQVVARLAVVKFVGRCDTAGIRPHPGVAGPLGWTHVSDGEVLPFSSVDCDGIRNFLQMGLLGVPARERDEIYGRAIARVLAHELYHVLAKTVHHRASGVGKVAFSTYDLLGDTFVLDEMETERLRGNNSHPAIQTDNSTR